jgi:hypothetical protein
LLTLTFDAEIHKISFLLEKFGRGFIVMRANVGDRIPSWIGLPRLFLTVLSYGAGSLLWLSSLIGFRKLGTTERQLSAAFSGFVLLTVTIFLLYPGGLSDLRRPLAFGMLLPLPFLLLFLQRRTSSIRRMAVIGLTIVLLVVSFPAFLSNHLKVATEVFHGYEFAGGRWLRTLYGGGKGLDIFASLNESTSIQFYLTDAQIVTERSISEYSSPDEKGLWQATGELLERYESSSRSGNPGFFVQTPKLALYSAHLFGIPEDHPKWREMIDRLSEGNRRVYDNGALQVFAGGR